MALIPTWYSASTKQIAEKALKHYQTLFPSHYNSLHIGNENSFYVRGS